MNAPFRDPPKDRDHFFIPLDRDYFRDGETDPYRAEEVLLRIFRDLRDPGVRTAAQVDFSGLPSKEVFHAPSVNPFSMSKGTFALAWAFIVANASVNFWKKNVHLTSLFSKIEPNFVRHDADVSVAYINFIDEILKPFSVAEPRPSHSRPLWHILS